MDPPIETSDARSDPVDEIARQEILGYLNFSSGKPDARFQQRLNRFRELLRPDPVMPALYGRLRTDLARLQTSAPAFRNCEQAESVLMLVFERVVPAYREHHADLLFHLPAEEFWQPLFLARICEATLTQGPPWNEPERIVAGALKQLNDFVGHRPVAVLENGRQMQPYVHERFRPAPLYIKGAGAAAGPYYDLVVRALEILAQTPDDILASAFFDLNQLDELAVDVRAFDHSHPVYKRTNYTFGEWDPHLVDIRGRYSRFVVRSIILDSLLNWMREALEQQQPAGEVLYEAAAVLAGTMLMASAVSGSGPDTHDSNVSLTSLLPRIARQRDAFYTRLLQSLTGTHADRLRREAEIAQQPFGKIRQHLNLYLAHYGCRQMQRANLSELYARMGYPEASRRQAEIIPSTATRFECEMQSRITASHLDLDRGGLAEAAVRVREIEDFLHRGIDCGAIMDPWNILGFQGQFPLFACREDSISDPRVERLLSIMDQTFALYARLLCEAAAAGERGIVTTVAEEFRKLAEFWDRFATTVVTDLEEVHGGESFKSASQVSEALLEWSRAGEGAGDVAFWKSFVGRFESAKAYAIVLDILLRRGDVSAAMSLLVQWLSEADTVQLESGAYSFHPLVHRWINLAIGKDSPVQQSTTLLETSPAAATVLPSIAAPSNPAAWERVKKFFDYLEANAGDYWSVPTFEESVAGGLKLGASPQTEESLEELPESEQGMGPSSDDEPLDDEEFSGDQLFEAAYENVTFRDSAQDGHAGDTLDSGDPRFDTDLELITRPLEQRLRFLVTLAHLWKTSATAFSRTVDREAPERNAVFERWHRRCLILLHDLMRLAESLTAYEPRDPEGDPDSLVEYDHELHVKYSLLNAIGTSQVSLQECARWLRSCLPETALPADTRPGEQSAIRIQTLLLAGKVDELRSVFPAFLRELSKQPLLYVPLDKGGDPKQVLAARRLQSLIRTLLVQLPRGGLLRETWHLLRTAYLMERTSPPGGMSITEFDRLLQSALRSSLESLIRSSQGWGSDFTPDDLAQIVGDVTEIYYRLWLKHSATMRLSSIEALKEPGTWKRVKAFIRDYGAELFQTRLLTLGNLRGIVHRGADWYLDYLEETEDPLHRLKLLEDLKDAVITRDEAQYYLELILRCVVEKFDRFMEYNTTTTQSDYGEQLHCLLDFLRLEANYERHAWNLVPRVLAHEALLRGGMHEAAAVWHEILRHDTAPLARRHLQKLKRLEKQYAMRLPSITDRLSERFVKPLALDRILSLVEPSVRDAKASHASPAFERMEKEVEQYLSTTSGSALELQPWLQSLSDEVQGAAIDPFDPTALPQPFDDLPPLPIDLEGLRAQIEIWEKPLKSD